MTSAAQSSESPSIALIRERHNVPDVKVEFEQLSVRYIKTEHNNTFVVYQRPSAETQTTPQHAVLALNGGGNNALHNFAPYARRVLAENPEVGCFIALYNPLTVEEVATGKPVQDTYSTLNDLENARTLCGLGNEEETVLDVMSLSISSDQLIAGLINGKITALSPRNILLISPTAIFPETRENVRKLLAYFKSERVLVAMRRRLISMMPHLEIPPNMGLVADTSEEVFKQLDDLMSNPHPPNHPVVKSITLAWASNDESILGRNRERLRDLLLPFAQAVIIREKPIEGNHGHSMQKKYINSYMECINESVR